MRSPLQITQMTARHLAKLDDGQQMSAAATRLIKSGGACRGYSMTCWIFSRTKLGLGIGVASPPVDVAALVALGLEQLRVAHETQSVELDVAGTREHCATAGASSRCLATTSWETRSSTGRQRRPCR